MSFAAAIISQHTRRILGYKITSNFRNTRRNERETSFSYGQKHVKSFFVILLQIRCLVFGLCCLVFAMNRELLIAKTNCELRKNRLMNLKKRIDNKIYEKVSPVSIP